MSWSRVLTDGEQIVSERTDTKPRQQSFQPEKTLRSGQSPADDASASGAWTDAVAASPRSFLAQARTPSTTGPPDRRGPEARSRPRAFGEKSRLFRSTGRVAGSASDAAAGPAAEAGAGSDADRAAEPPSRRMLAPSSTPAVKSWTNRSVSSRVGISRAGVYFCGLANGSLSGYP